MELFNCIFVTITLLGEKDVFSSQREFLLAFVFGLFLPVSCGYACLSLSFYFLS